MRVDPDATGKILNNLFRISAWSQWARRASTETWPLGTTQCYLRSSVPCKCNLKSVLHRGAKRTQNLCGNCTEMPAI